MTVRTSVSVLQPAMISIEPPRWPSATWITALDLPVDPAGSIELKGAEGYRRARLLVRRDERPVAFVHLDVVDGCIVGSELAEAVGPWNGDEAADVERDRPALPTITVVICTRDRTSLLREALASVLACEYPSFDVVVVDNASSTDDTVDYVGALMDPRVRVVTERRPGLAIARNTGVLAADADVIVFTDDDVVVDRLWLRRLGEAFGADDRIGCVTGIVPSGELRTPTQSYFEKQVNWSSSLERRVFDLADPPPDCPLFPFQVGLYGTGASFGMPRSVILELGGFDEGLGVGSPTGGGEDIDMFVRIITGGWQLVYEPAAIVWHRHRSDVSALGVQARGYGLGLGAWLTKIALDRTLRSMAVRRVRRAIAHLGATTRSPVVDDFTAPPSLRRAQLVGVLRGPLAYNRSRRQGRRRTPLAS